MDTIDGLLNALFANAITAMIIFGFWRLKRIHETDRLGVLCTLTGFLAVAGLAAASLAR